VLALRTFVLTQKYQKVKTDDISWYL